MIKLYRGKWDGGRVVGCARYGGHGDRVRRALGSALGQLNAVRRS